MIAVGVNTDGRREVLGMTTGHSEAEPFWVEFLRSPHAAACATPNSSSPTRMKG